MDSYGWVRVVPIDGTLYAVMWCDSSKFYIYSLLVDSLDL